MYFHSCTSIRGCALFSLWNSPHHRRPKTVENKGSNVRYNKIDITFGDWVIVKNIIPRNMIINPGCASVDNHIPRDDVVDYHPIRERNIYITSSPMGNDRSPLSQHNIWRHHNLRCSKADNSELETVTRN